MSARRLRNTASEKGREKFLHVVLRRKCAMFRLLHLGVGLLHLCNTLGILPVLHHPALSQGMVVGSEVFAETFGMSPAIIAMRRGTILINARNRRWEELFMHHHRHQEDLQDFVLQLQGMLLPLPRLLGEGMSITFQQKKQMIHPVLLSVRC
jgi:hypothetical protein